MAQLLSDAQIKSRQKKAAHLGYATAGMGVTALGLRGGAGAIRQGAKLGKLAAKTESKVPGALTPLKGLKQHKKLANKLERASNTTGTLSLGVGTLAGFNGARLSSTFARKRDRGPVAKAEGNTMLDFGLSGVRQITRPDEIQELAKAYDPEHNRQRRTKAYSDASIAGAGGLAVGAGMQARSAKTSFGKYREHTSLGLAARKSKNTAMTNATSKIHMGSDGKPLTGGALAAKQGTFYRQAANIDDAGHFGAAHIHGIKGLKSTGKAAALAAGAGGAVLASRKINDYSKNKGRSYGSRSKRNFPSLSSM